MRISGIGLIGSPAVDQFSFGLSMAPFGGSIADTVFDEPAIPYWNDVADSIKDMFARAESHISAGAILTEVKVAFIETTGAYVIKPPLHILYNQPGFFPTAGRELPQASLCISLMTDVVGPRTRGRFYLPIPSVDNVGSDGFRISIANAQVVRGSIQTMLNDINNAPGFDGAAMEVCVASSTGINTKVTGVRVGRVIDTVRTRRNSITEDYTGVAVVS